MTGMHPVERLWQVHQPSGGYPPGVLAVPAPIPGIGFFPGGYGLWRPDIAQPLPGFPEGEVMVLGHDFHSKAGYDASVQRAHEALTQPTWRNLLALLAAVGIDPQQCFFTNIYMGLRGSDSAIGPFPGASDAVFVRHCEAFLREQLAAQRPRLILTLGVNVPSFLARVVPELGVWRTARTLRQLDESGPVQAHIRLPFVPPMKTTIVALTHPSLRHASVRHRRYNKESGSDAELAMLRDALRLSAPAA